MKQIHLTQGKIAIISDKDYPLVSKFKWFAVKHGKKWRACRSLTISGKKITILMHRLILNVPAHLQVDHRNGDSLDNRRKNLRPCTNRQNNCNRPKQANNTSGYKGVYFWDRGPGRRSYHAKVGSPEKGILFGGYFHTAKEAALKYDQMAKKLYGKFAQLNFT